MLKRLLSNAEVMRYVKNSAWMLAEYGLKVISAIFVTIYVARYLGPEQFGILSYALAIVAIFMAISRLGMESILVRDLARYPDERQAYMGTAFGLMLIAAFIGTALLAGLIYFLEADPQTRIYIWVISSSLLFQTFLVVDYNFQSQVKAKYSSIAKSLALGFSALSKLVLVWLGADLFYFAVFHALDHLVIALFLLFMHFLRKQPNFIYVFRKKLIKPLLSSAWPMALSAVASILYMRVDQLMIKQMLGAEDLGVYVAASKIVEGWLVFPFVISISLLPVIAKIKNESQIKCEKYLMALFSTLFWMSFAIASLTTLSADWIVAVTFGDEYEKSAAILIVSMWSGVFLALGSISARYLTIEGMEKKIAFRTLLGLGVNVLLNFILIPFLGVIGSALATLITFFMVYYVINFFDGELVDLVRIINGSFLFKWVRK